MESPLNDATEKYIDQVVCIGSFYEFCKYMAPDFYKDSRPHLKKLCDKLQKFYEWKNEKRKLAISIPPRMGKTRTLILFCIWVFGLNPNEKVMSINYNETLSTLFSKQVRDNIQTPQSNELHTVKDIFPGLKIKEGSGAAQLWALDGKYMSYLGGSPTGTLTGLGASLTIIDDLVKNATEALNDTVLENHWTFYNNTLKQRMEEGCKEIVCFTRWATNDLIGMLLQNEPDNWESFVLPAIYEDGSLLCPDLLSSESLADKSKNMLEEIYQANYFQVPMDIKGVMYHEFKTYSQLPEHFESIENYTDTADEGDDYLCSITYGKLLGISYILDIVYTKDAMEVTEGLVASSLMRNKVKICHIESNNGGRGFARSVEKVCRDLINNTIAFLWFHQSQNKAARIFNNSVNVQQKIFYPFGWENMFPEFARDIKSYKKEGKNKHDDAPDALTGVYEKSNQGSGVFGFSQI